MFSIHAVSNGGNKPDGGRWMCLSGKMSVQKAALGDTWKRKEKIREEQTVYF